MCPLKIEFDVPSEGAARFEVTLPDGETVSGLAAFAHSGTLVSVYPIQGRGRHLLYRVLTDGLLDDFENHLKP